MTKLWTAMLMFTLASWAITVTYIFHSAKQFAKNDDEDYKKHQLTTISLLIIVSIAISGMLTGVGLCDFIIGG